MATYADPLMDLLHSPMLNSSAEKSNELVCHIEAIEDTTVRQWCIDSLTILRDLERIELKLHGWEFTTLDYRLDLEKHTQPNSNDNKLKLQLATRVLNISLDLNVQLGDQSPHILQAIGNSRRLKPRQIISDAGTILTELVLRLSKLREDLNRDINVGYSRAKLVIIGCELEQMLDNSQIDLDPQVVNNYKVFVNTLLDQLDQSVTSGDTMQTMESIAIVQDVEKMFQSMKQNGKRDQQQLPSEEQSAQHDRPKPKPQRHDLTSTSPSSKASPMSHKRTTSSLRKDNDLAVKSISEHMPELLGAFRENPGNEEGEEAYEEKHSDEHLDQDQPLNAQIIQKSKNDSEDEDINADRNDTPLETKIDDNYRISVNTTANSSSASSISDASGPKTTKAEQPQQQAEKVTQHDDGTSNVPSLMSSLFGNPLLRAFYQPQMKEPIYIPSTSTTTMNHSRLLTEHDTIDGDEKDEHDADADELDMEESTTLVKSMYVKSRAQEEALLHERRMNKLQIMEQMRKLPRSSSNMKFLVPPQVTHLKEGRVRESVKVIEHIPPQV